MELSFASPNFAQSIVQQDQFSSSNYRATLVTMHCAKNANAIAVADGTCERAFTLYRLEPSLFHCRDYWEYIVVGAGPAGLQLGHYLQESGRDYVIMEKANAPG